MHRPLTPKLRDQKAKDDAERIVALLAKAKDRRTWGKVELDLQDGVITGGRLTRWAKPDQLENLI